MATDGNGRHFKGDSGETPAPHMKDITPGKSVTTTNEARNYYGDARPKAASTKRTAGYRKEVPTHTETGRKANGKNDASNPYLDPETLREKTPTKRSKSRIISNILIFVGIALLLTAVGMWGYSQWQYSKQDQENEKLAQYAQVSDDGSTAPVVDWASLKAINGDVIGWIQIPGTVISYPVYQSTDNDYYLNTNAEGQYGVGGQIFLDYQNTKPGMLDEQSIIYGHHLKNGAMFKQVADMDNQEMFNSISTVWYVTEDNQYELEPLFVYYTNPEDTNVRIFSWSSTDAYHAYLSDLLAKSVAKRSDAATIINGANHVLTLSTCNYIDGQGRTILVCALKSEAQAATAAASASAAATSATS